MIETKMLMTLSHWVAVKPLARIFFCGFAWLFTLSAFASTGSKPIICNDDSSFNRGFLLCFSHLSCFLSDRFSRSYSRWPGDCYFKATCSGAGGALARLVESLFLQPDFESTSRDAGGRKSICFVMISAALATASNRPHLNARSPATADNSFAMM